MTDKQKKIYKIIIIVLAMFLFFELIYFGIKIYNNRKNSTFYDVSNSIILTDENNYVSVGSSDFRHSKFNEYDNGYEKATITKVKNGETVKEVALLLGFDGRYNDVIKTSDGYIAVGRIEMTKEQHNEKMSEAVIVKYDNNLKLVWRKNLSILEKTEFKKVKIDKDDIVVVGTSVYSDGYIGNHTTGGGILVKYDKNGKELLRVNNGGPYTGVFNDLIVEDNSYVVVGLGKANSGIIIRYDKKGKKISSGSFGYTDKSGFNAVVKNDNNYYVATTKVVNPKELSNYSAAIVKFNYKFVELDNVKYSDNSINYFNDIDVYDDSIYVCGYVGEPKDKTITSDAVIVKYDKNLYEKEKDFIKGNNNDFYSNIYFKNNNIYVLGYSNSKLKDYKVNGYDYSSFVKKYNNSLK